jgi:hypothetical protein
MATSGVLLFRLPFRRSQGSFSRWADEENLRQSQKIVKQKIAMIAKYF